MQRQKMSPVNEKQSPAVMVEGEVEGIPEKRFINTGLMVTLLQEDCWENGLSRNELQCCRRMVMLANKDRLNVTGRAMS